MVSLGSKLRASLAKIKATTISKERNIAIAEADGIIERMIYVFASKDREGKSADAEIRVEVVKLLAAIDRGNLFPGMRNYIKHPAEFDAAIDRLRILVGDVEEIEI